MRSEHSAPLNPEERRDIGSDWPLPVKYTVLEAVGRERQMDSNHFHNYLEIGRCQEGTGIMYIDGKEVAFRPNCLTVISPQVLHRTMPEPGCYSRWEYLFVDVEQLRSHLHRRDDEAELMRFLTQCAWLLEGEDARDLLDCFAQIAQTLTQREVYHSLESEGLMLVFLSRLYRLTRRELVPSQGKPGMEDSAIGPALFYIAANYMNEIHIGDLASKCLMSESYFRKRFCQAKGLSPSEYLNWYRINVACSLLLTTEDSILSIAGQTGFPSVTTFNRNFVRITKMPPAKWRAFHKNRQNV